jgi:hypothetical protein
MSESLSPDTDAITRNTLEWRHYRGGWLVRWKDRTATVRKVSTKDWNEADHSFTEFLEKMRAEVKMSR